MEVVGSELMALLTMIVHFQWLSGCLLLTAASVLIDQGFVDQAWIWLIPQGSAFVHLHIHNKVSTGLG